MFLYRFIRLYENPVGQEEQESKGEEGQSCPDDSEKEFLHTYINSLKERGELFWGESECFVGPNMKDGISRAKTILSLADTAPTYTTKVSLSCIL